MLLRAGLVLFAAVVARFDLFPSNALSVADPSQKTGLRINMPMPDCAAEPSTCAELELVNQMDGFELQPRARVRFSGPVNPDTLRAGIYFVWLENLTAEEPGLQPFGHVTAINQVSYDPSTYTAYARPDEFFDQHRRYALIVSNAVRDTEGRAVEPDPAFLDCLNQRAPQGYCAELRRGLAATPLEATPMPVVTASVFTTMTATAWLEKARASLRRAPIAFAPLAPKAVFAVSDIASVALRSQTGTDQFATESLPLALLTGAGRVAFGAFQSPSFLDDNAQIPTTPTGEVVPLSPRAERLLFQAVLPASPKPASGYPVIIGGHGLGDSRFGAPMAVAASAAARGFATIAINAVGHGLGPSGTLTITERNGNVTELPLGGRSVDLNGDGKYEPWEGCIQFSGPAATGARDCFRQTALDLMQLVRAIHWGLDLDNDGTLDLDPNRIYYAGGSLGAMYGTLFAAVEPNIRVASLSVGGGTTMDVARFSQAYRGFLVGNLAGRTPSLLNRGQDFDDAFVLRYRPVRIIDVPGAVAIQEAEERMQWIQGTGDPVSYATHLWSSTLPGVPMKRVLFQYGWGDLTVPNPTQTNLIRAANMRDTTSFYRHDLARAAAPSLPADSHASLVNLTSPAGLMIALSQQAQIMGFLASGGAEVPDVNPGVRPGFGRDLFETPPGFLTEDLNFPK